MVDRDLESTQKRLLPENVDVLNRFEEIMERYKLNDNYVPYSINDCHKMIEDLRNLRSYIKNNGYGECIVSYIDELLNEITLYINEERYSQRRYKNFSTVEYLKNRISEIDPTFSIDSIKTKTEKVKHSEQLRKKIIELMGGFSQEKTPLNPRIIERRNCDKYIMEKVIFDSEPGVSVPSWLLIPKDISFPAPAIICLHQHAGEYYMGKDELVGISGDDSTQFYAKELAERGYITFTIDARCFGERIDNESKADYLSRWIGRPLLGMVVWDDIRSIDYLLTRKEVDPKRIGCIGHSLGGTRAVYLAALDDRIKVTVISCYVSSYKSLIKYGLFNGPSSTWLPGILSYADCQEVLSLIAPRPLLIINAKSDETVPIEGTLKTYNSVYRIYRILEAANKIKKIIIEGRHSFSQQIHEETYQWIDKWLKK